MFGRKSAESKPSDEQSVEHERVGGKGRPTPKRSEAEAARKKRMTPPKTRKEAAAMQRERQREARVKQRAAMDGHGDERYLPVRDQGPVRKYCRDYVDTHRTIGQFLLPIFVVVFVLVSIKQPWAQMLGAYAWVVILAGLVIDSIRIMRGVKKGIRERHGDDETKGLTMYVLMRAWQMRFLRLPKPTKSPGDPI